MLCPFIASYFKKSPKNPEGFSNKYPVPRGFECPIPRPHSPPRGRSPRGMTGPDPWVGISNSTNGLFEIDTHKLTIKNTVSSKDTNRKIRKTVFIYNCGCLIGSKFGSSFVNPGLRDTWDLEPKFYNIQYYT